MNNIMVDVVTLDENNKSPLCAIEAVCFEPSTGKTGAEFYRVINIYSARGSNGRIPINTAFEWMKKDAADRAQLIEAKESEETAICEFCEFLYDNTKENHGEFFLWFKYATKKKNTLWLAFEDIDARVIRWDRIRIRDIDPLIDLAKVTGYTPHASNTNRPHTITKARYQAEQVCEIWQRLTSPYFESL
ncbi:3'-5' exonuclease [Trabulsiella odontotermitis]|uniref:3'-5' exoribonuclease Rv2179c-like domain-containing protein n=1 Tax=Trabulsiella odontotermitis TaxID=379893 RepID=A0A0L0H4W5_9ENTR|nr:3'-5' exonuclease [Trabulsiella odontotermitis]KNC95758.1 hypothetical protein GM31_21855 [Trabulsiella odontotermitis]